MRERSIEFAVQDFEATIASARAGDLVYCDPPYIGRHVDYSNGWTEQDERRLCKLLTDSPADFIVSTWFGNQYRTNKFIEELWAETKVLTREHFYHLGANLENRGSMTEAMIHSDGLGPRTYPLLPAHETPDVLF